MRPEYLTQAARSRLASNVRPWSPTAWSRFANAVAERVAKVHPKALIYFLAYHADFPPPSGGLKLHPNVMVQVVRNRPLYLCINHPLDQPCERKRGLPRRTGRLAEREPARHDL